MSIKHKRKEQIKPIHLVFQSFSEYQDYLNNNPRVVGENASRRGGMGKEWDWGMTYNEAFKIISTGGRWEQGAELVKKRVFEYEQALQMGKGPSTAKDVAGFAPDVPEFIKGTPTSMINETDDGLTIAARPIVRIGVDNSMLCNVDSEYAINRGAAILTLIDFLESQGQRCEVWALTRSSPSGLLGTPNEPDLMVDVLVKPAHLPWDPGSVAFALAHPAWLRRLGFHVIETRKELECTASWGYGRTLKDIPDLDDWDIYFGGLQMPSEWGDDEGDVPDYADNAAHYETVEAAVKYIQEVSKGIVEGD